MFRIKDAKLKGEELENAKDIMQEISDMNIEIIFWGEDDNINSDSEKINIWSGEGLDYNRLSDPLYEAIERFREIYKVIFQITLIYNTRSFSQADSEKTFTFLKDIPEKIEDIERYDHKIYNMEIILSPKEKIKKFSNF